ncbi:MAG: hypothetical protein H6660_01165 [Ardenticatenaceae bacterium]|nr:hypothetical protein [Ardenticatenaceae bacterium]
MKISDLLGKVRRWFSSLRPFWLVTLWGLPLITPLLRWTAVPCTHDGHLHYHRVAAMRYAWENGLYFTRWLPDLAFGYGYPFFVYREPMPLYAVFFPHLLGLPLPAATNLFYALTILACGWFMFLWVRDVLDERAALVAAVAYMTAPYILIDALIRGNSPESLALPLFPLLLWSSRRWLLANIRNPQTASPTAYQSPLTHSATLPFLLSTFGLAFLSLSHNISSFIFVPTLLVYLAALAWLYKLPWRVALLRLGLIFGLGLGMTIFYTGGALLEMDQVTLQQSTTTRNNDFHYNFTSLAEIFAPVTAEDPQLLNPPLPFRLGWVVTALAAVGVVTFLWRQTRTTDRRLPRMREQAGHVWLMLAGTAVYLLLSLPLSLPVWENVPLVDFLQFPWRLVGRAALPLAFLAAVPFTQRREEKREERREEKREERKGEKGTLYAVRDTLLPFALFAALTLLTLETIPNLYPNYCTEKATPTINDVHEYEHVTGLVGVDPEGSYFPRTVAQRPASSPLEADYQAGQTPRRFDETVLPVGATVAAVEYGRLTATIHLTTPTPFTARYLSFAFPGWTATIDGESVPITPSDPEGLITLPVPAGTHTLIIRWRSTPLRTALLSISALAMLGTVIVAVLIRRKAYSNSSAPLAAYRLPLPNYRFLLILALALLAAKLLLLDRIETPLRRTAVPDVTYPLVLQGGELRLEGYNLSQERVPAGATFDIDMAWTAVSPPQIEYQTNVWLVGADGLTWSAKGTERPRLYEDVPATRLWQTGQWAWDSREVQVFTGTPPGTYDIVLTLFDKATLQPLTLTDAAGAVLGPTAVLGQITITQPDTPPEFTPQYPLTAALPDLGLTLLGYNQDRDAAAPGESVLLTLFWQRDARSAASEFTVDLRNEEGTPMYTWDVGFSPSELTDWQPGERRRGQYLLHIPAAMDSGRYQLVLSGETRLGVLQLNAPQRIYTPVDVETAVSTPFILTTANDQLATLVGYTLSANQSTLSITLVWQANAEFPANYSVFVHLVDAEGQLLTQSDGQPANWTRPTTGWAAGEYIIDTHQLTLPDTLPANLSLHIGLYDPDTNLRLQAGTNDFVTIPLP